MLFSEPKIPQFKPVKCVTQKLHCFSALQRAENSSIGRPPSARGKFGAGFQCSSASRKFLNLPVRVLLSRQLEFQCSSASRKFLNHNSPKSAFRHIPLFQCSSASRKFLNQSAPAVRSVAIAVSVLFSEPKIPQLIQTVFGKGATLYVFQCSSASRKFLNVPELQLCPQPLTAFQCSSASRKFLNDNNSTRKDGNSSFSALQRAENSSSWCWCSAASAVCVSVLFSEPKIPQ